MKRGRLKKEIICKFFPFTVDHFQIHFFFFLQSTPFPKGDKTILK